jgi:hypothetical protein
MSALFAVERARNFFCEAETMDGSSHQAGFLFLFELFTQSVKCRISGGSAHTFAVLLLNMYSDSRGGGLMGSILHILAANKDICDNPAIRYLAQSSSASVSTISGSRIAECPSLPN